MGLCEQRLSQNIWHATPHPSFASQNPPSPAGEGFLLVWCLVFVVEFYLKFEKEQMYEPNFFNVQPSPVGEGAEQREADEVS